MFMEYLEDVTGIRPSVSPLQVWDESLVTLANQCYNETQKQQNKAGPTCISIH